MRPLDSNLFVSNLGAFAFRSAQEYFIVCSVHRDFVYFIGKRVSSLAVNLHWLAVCLCMHADAIELAEHGYFLTSRR